MAKLKATPKKFEQASEVLAGRLAEEIKARELAEKARLEAKYPELKESPIVANVMAKGNVADISPQSVNRSADIEREVVARERMRLLRRMAI